MVDGSSADSWINGDLLRLNPQINFRSNEVDDTKHIIFHLIFAVLAIIVGFYIYRNYEEYSYYSELDTHGITTEAKIVEKPPDQSFNTIYYDQADNEFNKTFSVSSAMYDKYGIGDSIS